jgi:hypothetical protein
MNCRLEVNIGFGKGIGKGSGRGVNSSRFLQTGRHKGASSVLPTLVS